MSELLYGSPSHKPITSAEIVEWAAEFSLRNEDESRAYEDSDETLADDPSRPIDVLNPDEDEIVRIARERGHI